MTLRVVVVDDSALARAVLSGLIKACPGLQVVGTAADPYEAREKIRELDPDVITLDVEMPGMDGLAFLERLMRLRPMPVVMVSTLTARGAQTTLRALELGAVDFVCKPALGGANVDELGRELTAKLLAAGQARVARRAPVAQAARPVPKRAATGTQVDSEMLVAIGASTGGTEAIREVLAALPEEEVPGIVITQHMPAGFTASFAARLDASCHIRVKEAENGERILHGHAYVAPGGRHLTVRRGTAGFVVRLDDDEPVNHHRPSVEVLFRSVARWAGPRAVGLMLTGMGADGAEAMMEMRRQGAYNLVQDEASCVVFGMPRAAIACGAAHEVVPLDAMAKRLLARLNVKSGPETN